MSGTNSPQGGLTRRSFLKTTVAAAGATALVGGVSLTAHARGAAEVEGERVFTSTCRGNCGSRCPQEVVVREGKVVRVVSSELPGVEDEVRRLCVKGYTQPQRMYDPDRLKHPMKRAGWSPEAPNGEMRGKDEWERISWDEAIDLLGSQIKDAIDRFGGKSVAICTSYASNGVLNGTSGGFMSIAYGRFVTATGATVLGPSADYAEQKTQMFDLLILGNDRSDIENAKTIVAWGGNPAEASVHDWQHVCKAREKGAKLITIDPQFTASAMHSDIYVPIRPATDGALMLAMCNWIIDNDLVDVDFMKYRSVSPVLIKEDGSFLRMSDVSAGYPDSEGVDPLLVWDASVDALASLEEAVDPALLGFYETGGLKVQTVYQKVKDSVAGYTVEKASEICDIPQETIVELARMVAEEGPVTSLAWQGIGHHVNSHHNYKNLAFLGALTGNAGKPGASQYRAIGTSFPADKSLFLVGAPGINIANMYLAEIVETGKWAGEDLEIRVLWNTNGNMLCNESGRTKLVEAFKKINFVVCSDVSMTDTALYSDLLLPIVHIYESEDFDTTGNCRIPAYSHRAVDPFFECKSDLDIMRLIAPKIGLSDLYDRSDEEYLRAILDTPANLEAGYGYDAFHSGKQFKNYAQTEATYIDTFAATPTKRFQYYIENPVPRNSFGQAVADYERMPYYERANEAYWENPLREKYPLMGCSQHDKYHVHSQCAFTPWLKELDPEPMLKLNADDAADRGVADGDLVRVFNDRGYAVLKARVTEGIKPGVVSIPHGWRVDQYVDGHAQDLTSIVMNDFCSNSAFYDFLCEVEKYEGGAE